MSRYIDIQGVFSPPVIADVELFHTTIGKAIQVYCSLPMLLFSDSDTDKFRGTLNINIIAGQDISNRLSVGGNFRIEGRLVFKTGQANAVAQISPSNSDELSNPFSLLLLNINAQLVQN